MTAQTTDWVILRMAPTRTLKVVEYLRSAGIVAWAPVAMQRKVRPRSTKYRDVEVAVLPALAFADAAELPRLLALQHSEVSDHPAFTVLQHRGGFPRAPDAALQPLRQHEIDEAEAWLKFCEEEAAAALERLRRKKSKRRSGLKGRRNPRRAYVLGQRVQVTGEAFAGVSGIVLREKSNGALVISLGDGALELEVETCDLSPVHVTKASPEQATVT